MNSLEAYKKELIKLDQLIGGEELFNIKNDKAAKQIVKLKRMIQDDQLEELGEQNNEYSTT